jgi:two-component system, LytTR family, response regulator
MGKIDLSQFSALRIRTQSGFKVINTKEIVYIRASNKESVICLTDDREIVTSHLLKWYEENLSSTIFFRCHKTFIINCLFVSTYTSKGILLKDGNLIPLSIEKISPLEQILGEISENK